MRLEDFAFDLPQDRIALRPAEPRDRARLLVVTPDGPRDYRVCDLPDLLRPCDVLVFNDTRVVRAQLHGRRLRSPQVPISATLIERLGPSSWHAFTKPGRRLRRGDRVAFSPQVDVGTARLLSAEVLEKLPDGRVSLLFDRRGGDLDAGLEAIGDVPLPPYIAARRPADERDRSDYQTMFAAKDGAVAAPTAGLHFTPKLMSRLAAADVRHELVTLHVGPGTFLPVKSEDVSQHRMHAEAGSVDPAVAARLNAARAAGGRIVAVGTTSVRLLESAATPSGEIRPFAGETDIFMTPGYRFRAVDLMITNFHLPRSTLFMLVAAFSGLDSMHAAYAHALAGGYRFYSYGDASLLYPRAGP